MLHTKWNGVDHYGYSSHVTFTGINQTHYNLETQKISEIQDCITQTLATAVESTQSLNLEMIPCFCLPVPTPLTGFIPTTVSPFSSFYVFTCYEGGEKFWPEYEKRRGSENGIENGLMLLMDVETFENAHYLQ